MQAKSPEDIFSLFQQYMAAGDIKGLFEPLRSGSECSWRWLIGDPFTVGKTIAA